MCPNCGCKVCYQYDDEDLEGEELTRCAACGEIFSTDEAADDYEDFDENEDLAINDDPGMGA